MPYCIDPRAHIDNLAACSACEAMICTICNPRGRCADGCGAGSKRSVLSDPRDLQDEDPDLKSHRVSLFDLGEAIVHDSLRLEPRGTPFYAYVRDVHEEEVRGGDNLFHLALECFKARWFDNLEDDLSDLPKWIRLPPDAYPCHVTGVISQQTLFELTTGSLKLQNHMWVRIWIEAETDDSPRASIPVMLYLPA